jgi:hypothetical protein
MNRGSPGSSQMMPSQMIRPNGPSLNPSEYINFCLG